MPRKALDETTRAYVERAREDFPSYMALVHDTDMPELFGGGALPAKHHMDIINVLTDDSLSHSLIVAPRGAAKTYLVQGWLEWRLGRASLEGGNWANEFRVAYTSNTAHQAYKVSNAIKATIEHNIAFQACFPRVKPHKDKWSEPEWKVGGNTSLHSTFIATGVGGPLLGARSVILVFDDTDDGDNTRSKLEREKSLRWHEDTALPTLVPWGRAIKICTRWHEEDSAAWAMSQGWHTLYMKALEECDESCDIVRDAAVHVRNGDMDGSDAPVACPGHSYWPERFPVEWLEKERRLRPMAFARQYQNEITPYEGIMFKRDMFRNRFDWAPKPEEIRHVFATWDTAGTLTGRSYTVGLIVVLTKTWKYYVMMMYRDKMEYARVRDTIRGAANRFMVDTTVIEAKATGQPAVQELTGDASMYGNVVPVLPPGQRGGPAQLDWVEQITPALDEGRLWLPSPEFSARKGTADWVPQFIDEMLSYPEGSNDDIVVAMTQLIYHVEREKHRFEMRDRNKLGPIRYGNPAEERRSKKWWKRSSVREPSRKLLV